MVSDKEGEFVVTKTELDRAIIIHHQPSDRTLCEKANKAALEDKTEKVK